MCILPGGATTWLSIRISIEEIYFKIKDGSTSLRRKPRKAASDRYYAERNYWFLFEWRKPGGVYGVQEGLDVSLLRIFSALHCLTFTQAGSRIGSHAVQL